MKRKGFTLAEILITLAIIGVVATLTIPGTIKNYRNKVLMTQLQNTINLVKTAVANAMEDNAAEDFNSLVSSEEARENFLTKYFDTVNICYEDDSFGDCLAKDGYSSFDEPNNKKAFFGAIISSAGFKHVCAATTSGATICIGKPLFQGGNSVVIDTNGQEAPNVNGKDLFWFTILSNGKLWYNREDPSGSPDDLRSYMQAAAKGDNCVTNQVDARFYTCLPYIISHGWKFKF